MSWRNVLLLCVALLICSCNGGCDEPIKVDPPAPPDEPTRVDGGGEPPNLGQVDLVFYGMIAFLPPDEASPYLDAAFVDPRRIDGGPEHVPSLAIDVGDLHDRDASKPDEIVPIPNGHGLAVWRLESLRLDNVSGDLSRDDSPLREGEEEYGRFRWIPHMSDIFGTAPAVDPAVPLAVKVELRSGALSPIFADEDHKKEVWDIGSRRFPLADGVRLRVDLANAGEPLRLDLGDDVVLVNGGSTIRLACYPKVPPKVADDLLHFPHFYALRLDRSSPGPTPEKPQTTTPFPARCAPTVFK